MRRLLLLTTAAAAATVFAAGAHAHGYAGKRFFPATILIEDPFVADELALPTYTRMKGGEEAGVTSNEFEAEFAKRITPNFALSIGGVWSRESVGDETAEGFGNIELGAKYQFLKEDDDEFVMSAGLSVELGGTGATHMGVEDFDVWTPALYAGKGFGSLPDSSALLRPFAVTGFAGLAFPDSKGRDEGAVNHVNWGAAIEYSLPYLHANVRDIGLPDWANQITPIVEMSFSSPAEDSDERTTGTINPGFIWSGQSMQIGAEAVIPINRDSGDSVGFTVQVHFYLDDLFPNSIGKPIFAD